MKIVRLGMTESGLLFLTWASKNLQLAPDVKKAISKNIISLMNWLYTTSGYYDKSVPGTKFNFDVRGLNKNFTEYINHLAVAVRDCEQAQFYFHDGLIRSLYEQTKELFQSQYQISNFTLLNDTKFSSRIPTIFNHMKNKKVLVISAFSGIIEEQFNNGNVYKLELNFPEIQSVCTVTTPYCFLNNGPHNNYFETLDSIYNEVITKDFDIALLGCGAYGHMLTHKIHELGKDAIYIGGCITNIFGILSSRERQHTDLKINEYWITEIPECYRPDNYKDIENGCYW
jgi:hypothetical protein